MGNATTRHNARLYKEIDKKLGKGKAGQLLKGFMDITGNESPEERAKWANSLMEHLNKNIDKDKLIEIREECACFKCNKNSSFAIKYFPELRKNYPNENEYINAVAEFMTKKGRCGKKAEVKKGEFISYFYNGLLNECTCGVIKKGIVKPFSSTTWCRCCAGLVKSVYQYVFPGKMCHVDIIETIATGGKDCIFRIYYKNKKQIKINEKARNIF
jgi:hypothetical protein